LQSELLATRSTNIQYQLVGASMNLKISTISSIAALLLGSGIANAQTVALPGTIEIPEGSSAYPNAEGNAIRTGLGDCLKLQPPSAAKHCSIPIQQSLTQAASKLWQIW